MYWTVGVPEPGEQRGRQGHERGRQLHFGLVGGVRKGRGEEVASGQRLKGAQECPQVVSGGKVSQAAGAACAKALGQG